jgi:hypothetical protein
MERAGSKLGHVWRRRGTIFISSTPHVAQYSRWLSYCCQFTCRVRKAKWRSWVYGWNKDILVVMESMWVTRFSQMKVPGRHDVQNTFTGQRGVSQRPSSYTWGLRRQNDHREKGKTEIRRKTAGRDETKEWKKRIRQEIYSTKQTKDWMKVRKKGVRGNRTRKYWAFKRNYA